MYSDFVTLLDLWKLKFSSQDNEQSGELCEESFLYSGALVAMDLALGVWLHNLVYEFVLVGGSDGENYPCEQEFKLLSLSVKDSVGLKDNSLLHLSWTYGVLGILPLF